MYFYDLGKNECPKNHVKINADRFISKNILEADKSLLNTLKKEKETALKYAYSFLNEAQKYHFMLEKAYSEAMDFPTLEKFKKNFINKVIKI